MQKKIKASVTEELPKMESLFVAQGQGFDKDGEAPTQTMRRRGSAEAEELL